jgi:sugar lactone lactonase YvrE
MAGDGVAASIRNSGNLEVVYSRTLNLEQVLTLDMSLDGSLLLAGDHSGRLMRVDRVSGSVQSTRLSDVGLAGACFLDADGSRVACWDQEGRLRVLDADLTIQGAGQLNAGRISANLADSAGGRLLLGTEDGRIFSVSLSSDALTPALLATLPEAVVGLGLTELNQVLAMTPQGRVFRIADGSQELLSEPAFDGQVLRIDAAVETGQGVLLTDQEARILDLADGHSTTVSADSAHPILDLAFFQSSRGVIPLQLVLRPSGLAVEAVNAETLGSHAISGWSPDRMATAASAPLLALMSSDGNLLLLQETDGVFEEVRRLEADGSTFWTGMRFVDGDRALLVWGRGTAVVYPVDADLPQTRYSLQSGLIPEAVAFEPVGKSVLFANWQTVYAANPDGTVSSLYTAETGDRIRSLRLHPDRRQVDIHTAEQLVTLNLWNGEIARRVPRLRPAAGNYSLNGVPFHFSIAAGGDLSLEREDADPLVAAFQGLSLESGGGLWTGYLGHLTTVSGSWIKQRDLGWAFLQPGDQSSWFWMQTEGWLYASGANGRFLYSLDTDNWLYCFIDTYATNWIYDYAIPGWRRFGQRG